MEPESHRNMVAAGNLKGTGTHGGFSQMSHPRREGAFKPVAKKGPLPAVSHKMDHFLMRHGNVRFVGKNIMSLSFLFNSDGQPKIVAVKDVCFVGHRPSNDLHHDFVSGENVMVSAVRDPSSVEPHVWKSLCVWTTDTRPSSFKFKDWESQVAKFYTNAILISNILVGPVDAVEKCVITESRILQSLNWKIQCDLQNSITHKSSDNFNELLSSDNDFQYVKKAYGSVADFVLFHRSAFRVSASGHIYPAKNVYCLERYLENSLPGKINGRKQNQKIENQIRYDYRENVRYENQGELEEESEEEGEVRRRSGTAVRERGARRGRGGSGIRKRREKWNIKRLINDEFEEEKETRHGYEDREKEEHYLINDEFEDEKETRYGYEDSEEEEHFFRGEKVDHE